MEVSASASNPDGCWPFASLKSTATAFSAVVHDTVPATETLYQADTQVTLTLTGITVSDRHIDGNFALTTSAPSLTHRQFPTREGTFILFKQPWTLPPEAVYHQAINCNARGLSVERPGNSDESPTRLRIPRQKKRFRVDD